MSNPIGIHSPGGPKCASSGSTPSDRKSSCDTTGITGPPPPEPEDGDEHPDTRSVPKIGAPVDTSTSCPTTTDAPGNATGHAARAVRQNDVTASNRNTSGPPLRQPKSRSLADTHTRRGPSVTASRLPEGLSGARPFDPPLMGPPGFLPSIVKDPVSATPSKSISEFSSPKTGADQLEMAIAAPINKPKILPRDIVRPFPNTLLDLPRSVQVTEAKC